MATVTATDGKEVSREQALAALQKLGIPTEYANFIVAVERGETKGDAVAVDEDGEEIK